MDFYTLGRGNYEEGMEYLSFSNCVCPSIALPSPPFSILSPSLVFMISLPLSSQTQRRTVSERGEKDVNFVNSLRLFLSLPQPPLPPLSTLRIICVTVI